MERQATVQVNFKLGDLKGQINNTVSGLGRGVGESTGIANDRRMKEQAEATKGLARSMQDLAAVAVTSGLAMTGFVGAASPDALDTLWGSVKLLSGEIGKMFIPAVVEVSGWLQQSADFVRNLDVGMQGWIGTIATSVAGVSTLGFAIVKLSGFLSTAGQGLKMFGSLLTSIGPLGWLAVGITAVATAIGTMSSNMDSLANSAERAQQALGQAESLQGAQGPVSSATIGHLSAEDRKKLATLKGAARDRFIQQRIQELGQQQATLNAGEFNVDTSNKDRPWWSKTWGSDVGAGMTPQARFASIQESNKDRPWWSKFSDDHAAYVSGVSGQQGLGQTSLSAQIFKNIQQFGASAAFGGGTGTMLASNFNSRQVGSASSYYDTIVQRALSGSELNKRLEQLQEEGNAVLVQIRDGVSSLKGPSI